MKTSEQKVEELKKEAKKEMGVNLDIPLWGKVRLFALAASHELNTQASVSPFKNGEWGITWVGADGQGYFKGFSAACFALDHKKFIEHCFGNSNVVQITTAAA